MLLQRLSLLMVLMCSLPKSGHSALITIPRDTEVLINHSTYFNCSTSILSEQIHWYHYRVGENQTNYVYYKGQFNQIYAERYSIEINTKTGEYNLIIQSAQPGDAGRYVCQDDGGLGQSSPAELIVLDSTPTCLSSMKPDGFVGPNSCYLPMETLQFSCSVSYIGNSPPLLEWKMESNEIPISRGITTDYSGKHATLNLTMSSAIEMDGVFFTCGTTRSQDKQLSCTTDPVKINYVVGQPTILNTAKGENITCSANASVPCTYKWFYNNETQNPVSHNQVLTTNRLGNHSCEACCPINGINCTFVAIRIIVIEEEPSHDTTKTLLIAILIPTVAILLMIISGVLFYTIRKRQQSTRTADQRTPNEMQTLVRAGGTTSTVTCTREKEITTKDKTRAIAGVAILEELIYVVHDHSSEVETFNAATFELRKCYTLKELVNPWDLASCTVNKCLYIMNRSSTCASNHVIRIDSSVKFCFKWSTKKEYGNLSVTSEGNVVVTFSKSRRLGLLIFGPDGTIKNRLTEQLPNYIIHPSHALKLSNGQFLVCYGKNKDNVQRVGFLDEDVVLIENSFEKMETPSYLAVDDTDVVFVAVQGNSRVCVLNSEKEPMKVVSKEDGLRGPQRICLNVTTRKLLVADNEVLKCRRRNGRLLVFSYDLESR